MKSTLHVTIMLSRSIVSTSVVGMSALTNDCTVDSSHKMLNFNLNKQYINAKGVPCCVGGSVGLVIQRSVVKTLAPAV